jgi:type I restriction enzyme R subunit
MAAMISDERKLEEELLDKLRELKYEHRPDIRDRASLEKNFREKFQALNHVKLTDGEFQRLLDEIVTPDVFTAAHTLRNRNAFTRDDGTPLNYTLVNINDWCKNDFEVVSQLRINTDCSRTTAPTRSSSAPFKNWASRSTARTGASSRSSSPR